MKPQYDLVIIGAGIHGVAIADVASARGLSVLVLEQGSLPASGTSSKSSKLVHGGLRDLAQFKLRLVYECLRERRRLLKRYPSLVRMRKFYIPVYRTSSRPRWMIRLGLTLYSLLAGTFEGNRICRIPRAQWQELDGLDTTDLLTVYQYFDAQTNDAHLTARILDDACARGVTAHMKARMLSARRHEDCIEVEYQYKGQRLQLLTKTLINAAGPWANYVADLCIPRPELPELEYVQGTHIELPGQLHEGCYYMESARDSRAIFALPWKGHILVGATETVFKGEPSECVPLDEEIEYLLERFNQHFPSQRCERDSIIDAWAGLRVLPKGTSGSFGSSRETILKTDRHSQARIVSIYGGKLTNHHTTAVKVMALLKQVLEMDPAPEHFSASETTEEEMLAEVSTTCSQEGRSVRH